MLPYCQMCKLWLYKKYIFFTFNTFLTGRNTQPNNVNSTKPQTIIKVQSKQHNNTHALTSLNSLSPGVTHPTPFVQRLHFECVGVR